MEPKRVSTPRCPLKGIVITVCGLAALFLAWPFHIVPVGSRGVVTQSGKVVAIENEGFKFLPPWQQISLFSVGAEAAHVNGLNGTTRDMQPVKGSVTIRYSVDADRIAEIFADYSHDGDLSSYVQTTAQEVLKAVTAKYTAKDLFAERMTVMGEFEAALRAKLSPYGARLMAIDTQSLSLSDSYMEAMKQEERRRAAEDALRAVEAEKQRKIALARAEAKARRMKADAEAYAKIALRKAENAELRLKGCCLSEEQCR